MQTQDFRDAYYCSNCTSQLLSVSNRDILITLKSHSWTHSPKHALQFFCSLMQTSQLVMKTWHFSPWTLHYCAFYYLSWIQFELDHENSILISQSSPDSFLTLCSISICTDTNVVTTSSEEFSEQTGEQSQSSGSLSVNRLWGDDSIFLGFCLLLRGNSAALTHCTLLLQQESQVWSADSQLPSVNTAEHTPTPTGNSTGIVWCQSYPLLCHRQMNPITTEHSHATNT